MRGLERRKCPDERDLVKIYWPQGQVERYNKKLLHDGLGVIGKAEKDDDGDR